MKQSAPSLKISDSKMHQLAQSFLYNERGSFTYCDSPNSPVFGVFTEDQLVR